MYIQPKEVSSPADLPIVLRTAATFPCCTATEIHWRRCSSDLGSPVTCLRHRLRSWMKERASGPNTSFFTTATRIKWWLESRWAYLETKRTDKQILIWYLHMCNPNLSSLSNQFTAYVTLSNTMHSNARSLFELVSYIHMGHTPNPSSISNQLLPEMPYIPVIATTLHL